MAPWLHERIDNVVDGSIGPRRVGESCDWIGRESGYADFTEIENYNGMALLLRDNIERRNFQDQHHFSQRPMDRNFLNPSCTQSTNTVINPIKMRTRPMTMEEERCLLCEDPCKSQFSRNNQITDNNEIISKPCKLVPVDVEDLAMCFQPDNGISTHQPVPRVNNSTQRSYRGNRTNQSSFLQDSCKSCTRYVDSSVSTSRKVQPNIEATTVTATNTAEVQPISNPSCFPYEQNRVQQFSRDPFGFCTEEKWLECPASDRCPLYDTNLTYTYATNVLPPCLYEYHFWEECDSSWNYISPEDERIMEDYL